MDERKPNTSESTLRTERQIIALARDGVVTRSSMAKVDIDDDAIATSVKTGLIRRSRRGIYLLAGAVLEGRTAQRAALAICDDAALSHWSAAHEHGMTPLSPVQVHFVAPSLGHIDDDDWFRAHATRRLDDDEVTTRRGRRITTVPRTIRDLAAFLPSDAEYDAQITKLIETAVRTKLTSLKSLRKSFARETSPLLKARLKRLLDRQEGGRQAELKSIGERWVRALFERLELPMPLFNVWVNGFESDAYLPDRRLNLEFDGFAFHKERTKHDDDRRRDRLLLTAGVNVGRLTDTDFECLEDVEREITLLVALAAPDPAPGVAIATVSQHPPHGSPHRR